VDHHRSVEMQHDRLIVDGIEGALKRRLSLNGSIC
jgi:hypothetical protein